MRSRIVFAVSTLFLIAVHTSMAAAQSLDRWVPSAIGDRVERVSGPFSQDEDVVEATSLLGQPLYRVRLDAERQEELDAQLEQAQQRYDAAPTDLDNIIWLGRRLAYRGRFREAVFVYSQGLLDHPDEPQLLRHRGHRWITLRQLDHAVDDLTRAAELMEDQPDQVEPDGIPNPAGRPTSTLKTNIHYHLALAHYLRGEWQPALESWRRCAELSRTEEMRVAALYWIALTLRHVDRHDEARRLARAVDPDLELVENHAYQDLLAVFARRALPQQLLQEARLSGDPQLFATVAYGVGTWWAADGDWPKSLHLYHEILRRGFWPAFGHIAAEAHVARQAAELGTPDD